MKKKLLAAPLAFVLALVCAQAQIKVESVFFDTRGGVSLTGGQPDLYADYFNLHVRGQLTPTLKYQLRQRLNMPLYDEQNPLNATDILRLTWDITPKWSFEAGKLPVYMGGYEWDDVPIDVYYWSDFCNTIAQIYGLGGALWWKPNGSQQLYAQFSHSLLHLWNPYVFAAAVGWYGQIFPWWKTIWGVNWMDDALHHHMAYVSLGNRFEAGPVALELDAMYRRSLIQKTAGFDGTAVARLEVNIGQKWSFFAKGGWDYNDVINKDQLGNPFDMTVLPGTNYFFYGAGAEYYPLGSPDVRLHAAAWADNREKQLYAVAGLTFRLHLVK